MPIQFELWHLIYVTIAFLGMVFGFGKLLLWQFAKRLDERFVAQEKARIEGMGHWDQRFNNFENTLNEAGKEWRRVERELMELKVELPHKYVRRDDYVRNQTIIESKLDAIYKAQCKGALQ
jgi:hypothetical protein